MKILNAIMGLFAGRQCDWLAIAVAMMLAGGVAVAHADLTSDCLDWYQREVRAEESDYCEELAETAAEEFGFSNHWQRGYAAHCKLSGAINAQMLDGRDRETDAYPLHERCHQLLLQEVERVRGDGVWQ